MLLGSSAAGHPRLIANQFHMQVTPPVDHLTCRIGIWAYLRSNSIKYWLLPIKMSIPKYKTYLQHHYWRDVSYVIHLLRVVPRGAGTA